MALQFVEIFNVFGILLNKVVNLVVNQCFDLPYNGLCIDMLLRLVCCVFGFLNSVERTPKIITKML